MARPLRPLLCHLRLVETCRHAECMRHQLFFHFLKLILDTQGRGKCSKVMVTSSKCQFESPKRLAIDPNNNNILYFGARSGNGLWKSTNQGTTWTKVANFPSVGESVPDFFGDHPLILPKERSFPIKLTPADTTPILSVLPGLPSIPPRRPREIPHLAFSLV